MKLFRVCLAGLSAGMLLAGPLQAAPGVASPTALKTCPLSVEEIKAATGFSFSWMNEFAAEAKPKDGIARTVCAGPDEKGKVQFRINQIWFEPATAATRIQAWRRQNMADAEPVPGVAEGAWWDAGKRLKAHYRLAYVRGNVVTEISLADPPADRVATLRDALLKLRQVP
jgi:hypothetical protein